MLTFIHLKNVDLLYFRVGAGAAGAASKFLPGAGASKKLCGYATRHNTVF
jgi:hypothetical protein